MPPPPPTVRSRNVLVIASIMKTKAKELVEKIIKGFQASEGWLDRWRNRYASFKTVSAEGSSYMTEMTAKWKKTTLPTILSKCKLDAFTVQMNLTCFFICNLTQST